jgi:hypothetical protein
METRAKHKVLHGKKDDVGVVQEYTMNLGHILDIF